MLLRWKPGYKTKLPILNWRTKYLDPASLNVLSIILTWTSDCVHGIGMYLLHVGLLFHNDLWIIIKIFQDLSFFYAGK